MINYKGARAHAGNLVHAVPVRDSDGRCKAIALCGKNAATSRRPVWHLVYGAAIVTCKKCQTAMIKEGVEKFKKIVEDPK